MISYIFNKKDAYKFVAYIMSNALLYSICNLLAITEYLRYVIPTTTSLIIIIEKILIANTVIGTSLSQQLFLQ